MNYKGSKVPTETNNYLARDGLYYNGYFLSNDLVEDFEILWAPTRDKICAELLKEIEESKDEC